MATKINPITVQSIGGYAVEITGIEPLNHDCIEGKITMPDKGQINGRWSLSGFMRDGVEDLCNLNMSSNELADLRELAKDLGATSFTGRR